MELEDSGIESDPKINNDTDTLKQHNEPIISFSPERCRFDSSAPNFQKSSTSSIPFSVTDLQAEDPLQTTEPLTKRTIIPTSSSSSCNANDSNPIITNLKNSSISSATSTTSAVPSTSTIPISQGDFHGLISTHRHNQTQKPNSSHIFLHNNDTPPHQLPGPSYSVPTAVAASPHVISTYSPSPATTLKYIAASSTTSSSGGSCSSKPGVLSPTTTCVDSNSIPLMINGSVISANSTHNSTLDLQKRLEKRIAQASAAVVATSSSNNSQSTASSSSSSTTTGKTKTNDSVSSILANILSSSSINPPESAPPGNGNSPSNSHSHIHVPENQITFSPQNRSERSRSHSQSAFQQKLPASLWESGSSASDIELLWESKLSSSKQKEESSKVNPDDSFMDGPREPSQVTQLQSGGLLHANPFVEEKESCQDERKELEIGKLTFISNSTCNDQLQQHHPTTATSPLENIGRDEDHGFLPSSNNNAITTANVNKGSFSESKSKANSLSLKNNNATTNMTSVLPSSASSTATVVVVNSGFDIRKVSALLPPQRLAIPCKPNPQLQSSHSTASSNPKSSCMTRVSSSSANINSSANANTNATAETTNVTFSSRGSGGGNNPTGTNVGTAIPPPVPNVHKTSSRKASVSETSCNMIRDGDAVIVPSGNGNVKSGSHSSKLSSEKKPLVQWDSDESEEELSFFPPAKRGVITDNLSIDNMSLSGEEEDLHLTPPRPLAKKCPCDPRSWIERRELSSSHQHHHHQRGDSIRNIVSRPCVIS